MKENYSDEVKNLIKRYTQNDFEYGKDLNFLTKRMCATQEEINNEIKKTMHHNILKGVVWLVLVFWMLKVFHTINGVVIKHFDILNCDNLSFTNKQIKSGETRYALFFIYNKKEDRKYIITFREPKLRVITAFPLGRKTLKKYRKKGLNIWLRH